MEPLLRRGYDWSDQPSGHTPGDVSPVAYDVTRACLRSDTRPSRHQEGDLADANDAELWRRSSLVADGERFTNAGSPLFVATLWPGVDYIRREVPGGNGTMRIEAEGRC